MEIYLMALIKIIGKNGDIVNGLKKFFKCSWQFDKSEVN